MEPTPVTPIQAESLVAVLGFANLLKRKPSVTQEARDRAGRLPAALTRAIAAYLNTKERAELTDDLPDFDFATVAKTIDKIDPMLQSQVLHRLFDSETADAVAGVIGVAVEFLKEVLPRRQRQTLVGAIDYAPSGLEQLRFERLYHVANGPLGMFEDLAQGIISRDTVRAFARLYPALYAHVREAVVTGLVNQKAKRPNWSPTHRQEVQLGILLQTESGPDVALASLIQSVHEAQKAPDERKQRRTPPPGLNSDESTPGQRASR